MAPNSTEYKRAYFRAHKETILASMTQKVKCTYCGSEVQKCKLNRHYTTAKCTKKRLNIIDID